MVFNPGNVIKLIAIPYCGMTNITAVIPAYNEESTIGRVLNIAAEAIP